MARLVDLQVTSYVWVPGDAGLTTPAVPKATEITAGTNITAFVLATTAINPTSSDTVTEKSIAESANVVVPTVGNYEGQLNLFRDFTAGVASGTDVFTLFAAAGQVGWLVRRVGLAYSVAYAVTQKVSVYKFMTDNPQETGGTGDGFVKLMVPLLQQGVFYQNVTTAA